ncbi:hypothetical protein [Kribbella endophytica]
MTSDTAAAERVTERLLAVTWDDDAAYRQQSSRFRLTREFLRRTAQWAQALGAEDEWPYGDLAVRLDPTVEIDPVLAEKLRFDPATAGPFPVPESMRLAIVRWATLGELPRQRFPELDDPYEPLLALFERGGAYTIGPGEVDLGYGAYPLRNLADRAGLEPMPIDEATLDALDVEN